MANQRAKEESPNNVAVFEEKEQNNNGQNQPRNELPSDRNPRDRARTELSAGEETNDRQSCALDLVRIEGQRAVNQEGLQSVKAVTRGHRKFRELVTHREHDKGHDATENEHPDQEGDPGGGHGGKPPRAQPHDDGGACGRHDQGNEHGDDHELELNEAKDYDGHQSDDQQ